MNPDLIRIIDGISRDKSIDRDSLIADIEAAMISAVRKNYGEEALVEAKLDLSTGKFRATVNGEPVDVQILGRIAAQTAKQMIIQKTRERERTSIYEDFTERRGTILTGTVVRSEGGNLLVNIGRTEGFLPRSEQIPGETHNTGERIRVLILEVREQPNQVKIILSRSHPEFIERLFEQEVPEVAEQIIEIKVLARESGYRTKVAVSSIDSKVDAVGACVGVRGSRIKNIVEELGGEKIDIVRWNESSQILIQNALKPAEVQEVALCFELGKATVVVAEDQLSLAIGKRGQNVRLAARLTGWDIDILTPAEYTKHLETMERTLKSVPGVDDVLLDKFVAFGCVSVADIDEIGPEPMVKELDLELELAEKIVEACGEEVIRQEEQREIDAKAKAEQERLAAAAGGAAASVEPAASDVAEGVAVSPEPDGAAVDREGEGAAIIGWPERPDPNRDREAAASAADPAPANGATTPVAADVSSVEGPAGTTLVAGPAPAVGGVETELDPSPSAEASGAALTGRPAEPPEPEA